MADCQDNTLRIVLVGKIGCGKSGTANTILGRREFESKISVHGVTKSCQKASREWKGRQLLVVDTPGLFYTKETLETTCQEISRSVITSCPGPHAIILVVQLSRFTEEEQKTVALLKVIFGKEAMKHMIVLFTCKDGLEEDQSLEDFIRNSDDELRKLIKECGDRCCAFNNKSTDEAEKEAQVQELVEIIDRMVRGNGGAYFSDNVYKDVEKRLQRKNEVLKKIYADELEEKLLLVEKEYEKRMEEKEKKIKQLRMKYEEKIKNIRS